MCRIGAMILVVVGIYAFSLEAGELQVDREAPNSVVFLSEAPLDNFEGRTDQVDGYVFWSDEITSSATAPFVNGDFHFEVALEDLDTGIGLRNRHMRENYLETKEYPLASFSGVIRDVQLKADSTYVINPSGTFQLHGVDQERTITVRATPVGDGYQITSEFVVKLEDHRIKVPSLMFMKINQNIRLSINFYLKEVK